MYEYSAAITKVIDGDTIEVVIDLGFHIHATHRLRLLGINCPELFHGTDEERRLGAIARDQTAVWVMQHMGPYTIQTRKTDGFGRYLGHIWQQDAEVGASLNAYLKGLGYGATRT